MLVSGRENIKKEWKACHGKYLTTILTSKLEHTAEVLMGAKLVTLTLYKTMCCQYDSHLAVI